MADILLDTNVILAEPSILAKAPPTDTYVVLGSVMAQLMKSSPSFIRLVREASKNGRVVLIDSNEQNKGDPDFDLLTHADACKDAGKDIFIATRDAQLRDLAKEIGVKTLTLAQLLSRITPNAEVSNQDTLNLANELDKAQKRVIWVAVAVGIVSAVLSTLLVLSFSAIVQYISVWGTIILGIAMGAMLYAWRGRSRLSYGVFEFVFAVLLLVSTFWPTFDYNKLLLTDYLKMGAAVYIMVRGLDNIGIGLKNTRWSTWWKKFAGESP